MKKIFGWMVWAAMGVAVIAALVTSAQAQGSLRNSSVYFGFRKSTLEKTHQQLIDSLLRGANKETMFSLTGYADSPGPDSVNERISRQRAESVRAYLLQAGIAPEKIIACTGKGAVRFKGAPPDSNAAFRRVDLMLQQPTHMLDNVRALRVNQTVRLRHIYFAEDSHQLLAQSLPELQELAFIMNEFPEMNIALEGHLSMKAHPLDNTEMKDGYDVDTKDYDLAEMRVKTIGSFLASKGINPNRINYINYGRTRPLVFPEVSVDDRNTNRRVELRVTAR